MPSTAQTRCTTAAPVTTPIPTPRRFLRCLACGTVKKERSYALCSECFRQNGTLPRAWFTCWMRHTEREGAQVSFRNDPRFPQACRVLARRRRQREARAALDATLPRPGRSTAVRSRPADEDGYDGLGPWDLQDLLDAQATGVELPEPERSVHREFSDAEIRRWDARVDAWAEAHGAHLQDEPAPEIQPWGYAVRIEGALVWTDDLA
jgi:hypothetical protein